MKKLVRLIVAGALGLPAAVVVGAGSTGMAAAAANKSPIVIGNVIPGASAPGLASGPTDIAVPKAWAAWTNSHGGINGHPVKIYQSQDNNDPGRAQADIQTLVNQDHVIALVGNDDTTVDGTYAGQLRQLGVPNIGGANFETVWETNPDYFATYATVSAKGYADVYVAHSIGAKSMAAAYCTEVPACLSDVQAQKQVAPKVRIKYTIGPSAPIQAPNYTAQCVVLGGLHAGVLYFSAGPAGIEQMSSDCKQQGLNQEWVLPNPLPTELTSPGLEKKAIGQDLQLPYFSDYHFAAYKPYVTAMDKYAPGLGLSQYPDAIRTWAALDVFKRAMLLEAGKPLTPGTVKKGLYALKGFNDNGLLQHLTYVPNKPTVVKCFVEWGIKNGKFTLPNGAKYICAP
ncbi:MAG TPA: ABC transporter substrate-binding protein [Acidimicrobiales bacterium]|nr:ABC transporter substrate-binding protein [Acidimicrobiales bacterium]